MSRFSQLALVLSLTACEHVHIVQTPIAPAPVPAQVIVVVVPVVDGPADPAPEAVAAPATPPVTSEVAPATQTAPATKVLVKKCNPMSRAGCRWEKAEDERDTPRVRRLGDR